MAYAADVLKSTLVDLLPDYTDTFTNFHPLYAKIRQGGAFGTRKLKGPSLEFNINVGGPGQMITETTGGALLTGGLRENLATGTEQGARSIYYFNVPNKSLDEVDTEYDFARIVKAYNDPAMAEAMEIFSNQLNRGASSAGSDSLVASGNGAAGHFTLNGDQTYNPQGTARQGLFDFAGLFTNTVHGIVMENGTGGSTGWKHQLKHISSFGANGKRQFRTAIDLANQQGSVLEGGIDIIIADHGTYQNYLETQDTQVQLTQVEGEKGKHGRVRTGIAFRDGVMMYPEPSIDISDTTAFTNANARKGVAYCLNSSTFEIFTVGGKNAAKDFFRVEDPIRLPNRDMMHYRVICYWNILCDNLRANAAVTGGAQQ